MEKAMAQKAEKIIVNSDYLKTQVANSYHVPLSKLHRMYKAVEIPEEVLDGIIPLDSSAPIRILFVKSDYLRGGLFTLAKALSLLPYQFILTIVGPNPADREAVLCNVKKYPNITENFLGKIPQTSVQVLLKNSHIFCVPSHREALGVANLEAMAHGVPVVSTDVGGIPEVLDQGRCGWLVPPNDAVLLASALDECIRQPDLRAVKLRNARAQARRFDPHTMFGNFIDILSC